jgi:hypothetical protein
LKKHSGRLRASKHEFSILQTRRAAARRRLIWIFAAWRCGAPGRRAPLKNQRIMEFLR